eukprot:CAMPEP_0118806114 /NCGR_PEP_ID=MMETSP1161-20130426/30132_1 /TAXON_ID=249345 /ORGANISM="Picochlorum oklahomensis, Strain CCMP2329" /LENGTH=47 /DNA_ID= /DNA_START= /DNA_END= /DNA_ORIENTATION=
MTLEHTPPATVKSVLCPPAFHAFNDNDDRAISNAPTLAAVKPNLTAP